MAWIQSIILYITQLRFILSIYITSNQIRSDHPPRLNNKSEIARKIHVDRIQEFLTYHKIICQGILEANDHYSLA